MSDLEEYLLSKGVNLKVNRTWVDQVFPSSDTTDFQAPSMDTIFNALLVTDLSLNPQNTLEENLVRFMDDGSKTFPATYTTEVNLSLALHNEKVRSKSKCPEKPSALTLLGVHVLQVCAEIADISQSERQKYSKLGKKRTSNIEDQTVFTASTLTTGKRCFKMLLTDGNKYICAVEQEHIPCISELFFLVSKGEDTAAEIAAGDSSDEWPEDMTSSEDLYAQRLYSKVLIFGEPMVINGILFLRESNCRVIYRGSDIFPTNTTLCASNSTTCSLQSQMPGYNLVPQIDVQNFPCHTTIVDHGNVSNKIEQEDIKETCADTPSNAEVGAIWQQVTHEQSQRHSPKDKNNTPDQNNNSDPSFSDLIDHI